ncbi:hypothetical protein CDAR_6211 [Caerostris darwini]|uniref:Homing endonuclease LAGLIDADG domain-containing protein n=1 Tax=Caerostris darwini TaxID=1538125 RepID=A0AAV4MYP8_9ARAC|nr:hypothetical protein CDAR_6211 [Caerostris darwini]
MDVGVLTTRNSQESEFLLEDFSGNYYSAMKRKPFTMTWRTRIPRDRRRLIAYKIYYDGARILNFVEGLSNGCPLLEWGCKQKWNDIKFDGAVEC